MYCPHCGAQNDESFKFCKTCGADLSATLPLDAVVKPAGDTAEPSELDLVRGELDEEYEILEELGRGGMAIVFRAREKQLDREVAIKVLPFSLAFDKEFVERFQREARTSAKLEHPNIIPIYRVGKSGRVIFFVMKFLRGKPLSSLLAARGALPPDGDPPGAGPGRARARLRAPLRHRAPRHQARQHHVRRARPGARHRLRHRQGGHRRRSSPAPAWPSARRTT